MQLSRHAGPLPDAADLPSALTTAAARLGHRPAIAVVHPDRRDEQGFVSLAQWAAKGAHLLQSEAGLEPGARVRIDAPCGWPHAAVCWASWWLGLVVTDGEADLVVGTDVGDYVIGDAVDGSPTDATSAEPWAVAVQSFPDRPPSPLGAPDALAADVGGATMTHADLLLSAARRWRDDLDLTVASDTALADWLPAVVRPAVTGRPTTVVV